MRLKIVHQPGTNDFPGFRTEGIPAIGEVRDFDSLVSKKLLAMNLAVEVEAEIKAPQPEPELKAVPVEPEIKADPIKQSKKGYR